MRRSGAPSKLGGKFNPPLLFLTSSKPNSTIRDTAASAPVENAARTTQSILGLIAKVKQAVDDSPIASSIETTNPQLHYEKDTSNVECQNYATSTTTTNKRVFNVVYGKPSKKKHKSWEGDGILEIGEKLLTLKDCEGNVLGRGSGKKNDELDAGSRLYVGNKEVEIIDAVSTNAETTAKRPLTPISPQPHKLKKRKLQGTLSTIGGLRRNQVSISEPFTPLNLPQPDLDHQWRFNGSGAPVTDVSVDPRLARVLRPHQRDGVTFLYRCITGLRDAEHLGAILADEMGLGKTLQCITLVWTLLRQGLYGNRPLLKKVLVVTPASLTLNWQQEFVRWLGRDFIHIFTVDQKNKPKDFLHQPNIPVMIISYEMLIRCYEDVAQVKFDLIICDEGHRLKNNSTQASTLLSQLSCRRRVLLTGTPVQNDLQEFYALVNFVNPDVLGSYAEFRKIFEESIVASREPDVDSEVKEEGKRRAEELSARTKGFVLRRTHAILNKYLPSKHEAVVFCKPSPLQLELFQSVISCWEDEDKDVNHLAVIMALKKICNHPILLRNQDSEKENDCLSDYLCSELERLCEGKVMIEDASKLSVVAALLHSATQAKERLVLISYYTQTLDLLAALCDQYGYKHCRLDGSTPASRRVQIVNDFNSQYSSHTVFLLSAKAGGMGLNLTGASRLVLFDSDWNPASDLQAMARIWRDGQDKSVHIYRLLTTGSIEEKIYQRQLSKAGLGEAVVDPSYNSAVRLSDNELKDLFTLGIDTDCLTHTMLPCDCDGLGDIPQPIVPAADTRQCQLLTAPNHTQALRINPINHLFQWEHYAQPIPKELLQTMGLQDAGQFITFVFRNVLEIQTPNH